MDPSRMPAAWRKLAQVFTDALPSPAEQQVVIGAVAESDDVKQRVYVGYAGDPADTRMAEFRRSWAGLGAKKQAETYDVPCAVVCWWGDDPDTIDSDADGIPDAFDQLLDQVFALFGAVDQALRADPGQGFPGPSTATLTSGSVVPDPGGLRVRLPFVVTFTGRI